MLTRTIGLSLIAASSLLAQTNNTVGFTKGWTTSFIDRIGANAIDADCLNHFDSRSYQDWMLDPADPTGATYKFNAVQFVIQDQSGVTPETFNVVAYNEDTANPNFPDAATPWIQTGAFTLPTSTVTTAVAWIYTITLGTPPAAPKGDKWIGVRLFVPTSGAWPATDGTSLHCAFDRAATSTSTSATDLAGLRIDSVPNNQFACHIPVVAGVPTGPGVYPAGSAGVRRQIRLEVTANVTGGVCITQTNQTTYVSSNPGNTGTPLGGTTNFISGLHPDVYNGNAMATPRQDDIGFLVTDVNFVNAPVFVMLALGPNPLGSLPLASMAPAVNAPGTRGNVCIDFTTAVTFLGFTNGTGLYQHMLTLDAGSRSIIQGMSLPLAPLEMYYQAFVLNPASAAGPLEVHATGCGIQHL